MKAIKKPSAAAKPRQHFFILLAVILAALFWRSFLADYIHFSNDAPLGQQSAAGGRLPDAFLGCWWDLNMLGGSGGAAPIGLSYLVLWILGPVGFAKFYAPVALFILGFGAWTFFRQLRLSPLAAVLGGLAAALNSLFLSRVCWGIGEHSIAIGMDFFAMALVVSNTPQTRALTRWVRLALAGLAVGINVMEGADVGAIMSLFVAAFVFFKALNEEGVPVLKKIGGGILRVAVVAVFAGFIALQIIVTLVGTQITGIVGTGQDKEIKAVNWDKATEWSLPKKESINLLVPGLFGYRMDTPKDMMPSLQDAYNGGAYWGAIGRDPTMDRFFDKIFQPGDKVTNNINTPDHPNQDVALEVGPDGNINLPLIGQIKVEGMSGLKLKETVDAKYASQGIHGSVELPGSTMRYNGDGIYCGILVALLAMFAIAQSMRRKNSPFTSMQKKFVWFWTGVIVASLLLAWGRFAPFYQFFYALPYVSTIRNPVKFLLVFSWALVILSAYGAHVLSRRYLEVPAVGTNSFSTQLLNWWTKIRGFDRKWTVACASAVAVSLLAWLIYSAQQTALVHYLQTVGFPDESTAKQIAAFSVGQAGWFILFFALAAGLLILILAGIFSGKRAKFGGFLLGALLVLDLGRANLPFIIHWDYKQKYEVGSLNPIETILADKPYEHRVADLRSESLFEELYRNEWMQHHFPYYNIQSLDIVQMPRMPADWAAFESALTPRNAEDAAYLVSRHWQLTNTRYLLGPATYLDGINQQFDPEQHRFRIVRRFTINLKPGVSEFHQRLEELTAIPSDKGDYALFEFTGALPRAKLYSNWQTSTNDPMKIQEWLNGLKPNLPEESYGILTNLNPTDQATLETLADKKFDPAQTVLVDTPIKDLPTAATNQNSGTVEFKSYAPKDIVFDAKSDVASILLLNDKYDPDWNVFVDGKPAELLRCNFIMRGVYLPPGAHTVEFQFSYPHRPLYVTLAAIATGIFLLGILVVLERRKPATPA